MMSSPSKPCMPSQQTVSSLPSDVGGVSFFMLPPGAYDVYWNTSPRLLKRDVRWRKKMDPTPFRASRSSLAEGPLEPLQERTSAETAATRIVRFTVASA